MSFNGSGTYNLPAGQPVVTGTTISSTTHNTLASDLATALSLCMTKDGQQTPTANLTMGGYRLTNLGAATAVSDAVRASQVQNGSFSLLGSVAGTNTITASASPTPAAYASGQKFLFIPANTNTGATTINISSLGAQNIFCGGAACVGGEIRQNIPVVIAYDGTQFNIIGPYVGGNLPGGQIAFPATQIPSSNANTLDDYEEGTWTPVLSDGTNNATMSDQDGRYTKVGRSVSIVCAAATSALGSVSGSVRITGLPFTPPTGMDWAIQCGRTQNLAVTAGQSVCGYIPNNNSFFSLLLWDNVVGTTAMQGTEWSDDGAASFSGTYFTD